MLVVVILFKRQAGLSDFIAIIFILSKLAAHSCESAFGSVTINHRHHLIMRSSKYIFKYHTLS